MTTTPQAEGIVERLRHDAKRSGDQDYADAADIIERHQKEIEAIRNRTIEECAKVAETLESGPIYWIDGRPCAGGVVGGEHIAKAIRALSSGGKE